MVSSTNVASEEKSLQLFLEHNCIFTSWITFRCYKITYHFLQHYSITWKPLIHQLSLESSSDSSILTYMHGSRLFQFLVSVILISSDVSSLFCNLFSFWNEERWISDISGFQNQNSDLYNRRLFKNSEII